MQKVQECDATVDATSTTDGNKNFKNKIRNIQWQF